ncbi:MAG TPA: AraC family transcriptional regulator [Rummeliibacillus sp.]|nr:AraC family transcriptional regulator [Rummeliibacillus sp.]
MIFSKLYFHIHYCNFRKSNVPGKKSKKVTRTLQHHELAFFTEGKGSFTINGKRYPIKGGMLIYICPNVQHFFEIDDEEPVDIQTIHFSYASINFNDSKWDIQNNTDMLPLQFVQVLKDYYQISDLFKKLVDSWNSKLPGYEFITKTLLQQLFIAIYQNIKKQNKNYSTSLKVEKVIHYMHQNVNTKVTLTDLAEVVQLSSTYLSRIFKDTTGYSVIGYFNKIKMDKAKELMIEGNHKVKEVAQALGFTDEFYFSRIFKKMEGVSPSEFNSKNVHGV